MSNKEPTSGKSTERKGSHSESLWCIPSPPEESTGVLTEMGLGRSSVSGAADRGQRVQAGRPPVTPVPPPGPRRRGHDK